MAKQRFVSGPWRGVLQASEPFLSQPEYARLVSNGYIPDPQTGSGIYSRPGFVNPTDIPSGGNRGQCVATHTTLGGTSFNFFVVNGRLYRWATTLSGSPVDVTPSNVIISTTAAQVFIEGYGDGIVVNDGLNLPWYGTDLSATPITATPISYGDNPVRLTISGSADTEVQTDTGFTLINGVFNSVGLASLALPAGTIPANQWGVYRVSVDGTGVFTIAAGAANYTTGYGSEAAAIAARPAVPTNNYDLGYFTLQTAVGLTFVAGADALQGGASGNPARDTNYYAGNPAEPWQAFGQPVVYSGSVFFIAANVVTPSGVTNARSTIVWSEPNFPLIGYQQTDYDNVWELTQTSTEPLFVLVGTNDVLYYFRQASIGALAGTPGINFQGTATHDVVSGNVGCIGPKTAQKFLNFIYFADQYGRPWRLAVGGTPEPIWLQAREVYDDSASSTSGAQWAVIDPNLNVYLLKIFATSDTFYVYDARSGAYFGFWTPATDADFTDLNTAGQVQNATGVRYVAILKAATPASDPVEVIRLTNPQENVWADALGQTLLVVRTPYQGYDTDDLMTPTHLVATAETGNSATPVAATGQIFTMNERRLLSSYTPPNVAANVDGIGRYVWEIGSSVTGRGVMAQVELAATTNQVKLYRIATDAVTSGSSIYDR